MLLPIIYLLLSLLTSTSTSATPVHLPLRPRSHSIYYLTNCYNLTASIQRAEIDYYASEPSSLPSSKQPTEISVLQSAVTLDYEDGTWFVLHHTSTLKMGPKANTSVQIGLRKHRLISQ